MDEREQFATKTILSSTIFTIQTHTNALLIFINELCGGKLTGEDKKQITRIVTAPSTLSTKVDTVNDIILQIMER